MHIPHFNLKVPFFETWLASNLQEGESFFRSASTLDYIQSRFLPTSRPNSTTQEARIYLLSIHVKWVLFSLFCLLSALYTSALRVACHYFQRKISMEILFENIFVDVPTPLFHPSPRAQFSRWQAKHNRKLKTLVFGLLRGPQWSLTLELWIIARCKFEVSLVHSK